MEDIEDIKEEQEDISLNKKDKRQRKKLLKLEKRRHEARAKKVKKLKSFVVWALVLGGVIWVLVRYTSGKPSLPPTSSQGHIEAVPSAHIVDTPITDGVQRHMLEHADGKGKPGVIIQYNCDKFSCEDDLIQKLTALVEEYPDNVYLAPNIYDGKIILSREGRREVLEEFDENIIRDFIERG